jgi:alkanesulfonate monooxygenase SsuD/methylene tetrahydromethanopterin reductase-like flavin-dependent oxidoreductase (luciferase family)
MKAPLAYLRNYIQILHPLLQQGEVHHQEPPFITDVKLSAASQTPLYISALGPAAFRLAGEIADGALPFLCPIPYLLNTAIPALGEGAATVGRLRPPVVAHLPVAITKDRVVALQAARQLLGFYTTLPTYRNMFIAAGFSEQEISTTSDTLMESLIVSGDEHQIKDRLQEVLSSEIDSLAINIVPISDVAQEGIRLAHLVSNL